MSVVYPSILLALFAAVLRPSTAAAFRKLACELFPFTALIVCALSNAASCIVLPAQVSHHNASPILHVLGMVADGKLLNEREDVEVIRLQILVYLLLIIVVIRNDPAG